MNNRGSNLTFMLIGIIVFVGVVILLFTAYNQFLNDNALTIDPGIANSIAQINNTRSGEFGIDTTTSLFGKASIETIAKTAANLPSNLYITFMAGLSILTGFLNLPIILNSIFTTIEETAGVPSMLVWVFVTIATIWVGSMVIKAIRGGEQA